jgi:heptosyltransferase-3
VSATAPAQLARPDDAIDLAGVRRVVVVMLRHHGDVLLTTPLYRVLKRSNPAIEIDVVVYHATRPLLLNNPDIAKVFSIDKDGSDSSGLSKTMAELRFMREVRRRRYDLLIHLSDHRRGAWLSRWVRPRISIAPMLRDQDAFWRGSFTHFWKSGASVRTGHPLLRRHTVEQHLDALRRLGIDVGVAPALTLRPDQAAEQLADQFLKSHGVNKPYVVVQPTSRWMFKCWSIANNAALIHAVLQRGYMVVLSCGPGRSEEVMLEAIVAALKQQLGELPPELVLANQPSTLNRLAVLIGRARAFVGIDSAPMHIAAAMGTPLVAMFGPSGEDNWAPWKGDSNLVSALVTHQQFACRPCGQDGCGGSKVSQCLVQLPVSQVLSAFDDVIARSDPWLDI